MKTSFFNLFHANTLLLSSILLLGCEAKLDERRVSEAAKDIKETLNQITKKVNELTPSKEEVKTNTTEEVEKLFIYEYKVHELNKILSPVEMEVDLDKLGNQRWECFHIEPGETALKVFCKRRPKTYLRYFPRMWPF